MKFSAYWILLITVILVIISVINISKMVRMISKESKNKELDIGIRNMLISIGLLSIVSFIYIILVFNS